MKDGKEEFIAAMGCLGIYCLMCAGGLGMVGWIMLHFVAKYW